VSLPAPTPVTAVPDEARQRLEQLFAAYGSTVYAFARRRGSAADAEDVVSDTFLVAWRRIGNVPAEPLPWLLNVARKTLANKRRGTARQDALKIRLAVTDRPQTAGAQTVGPDDSPDALRTTIAGALDELPRAEYDALTLVAWEGLTPDEVGTVLGCSRAAVYLRLSRARRRLRRLLGDDLDLKGLSDDDD
jgi:RNA polymerase sigma-70 factor (ECF subfamily)